MRKNIFQTISWLKSYIIVYMAVDKTVDFTRKEDTMKKNDVVPSDQLIKASDSTDLNAAVYDFDTAPTGYLSGNTEKKEKTLYQVKEGYVLRSFADEFLVIPVSLEGEPETKLAILSPVGGCLWSQLQRKCTLNDLVLAVTDEFDVTAEEARPDIEEFLKKLQEQGFLRETN